MIPPLHRLLSWLFAHIMWSLHTLSMPWHLCCCTSPKTLVQIRAKKNIGPQKQGQSSFMRTQCPRLWGLSLFTDVRPAPLALLSWQRRRNSEAWRMSTGDCLALVTPTQYVVNTLYWPHTALSVYLVCYFLVPHTHVLCMGSGSATGKKIQVRLVHSLLKYFFTFQLWYWIKNLHYQIFKFVIDNSDISLNCLQHIQKRRNFDAKVTCHQPICLLLHAILSGVGVGASAVSHRAEDWRNKAQSHTPSSCACTSSTLFRQSLARCETALALIFFTVSITRDRVSKISMTMVNV